MLWTVVPLEYIVEQEKPGEMETMQLEGRQVLVMKYGERRFIHQLLSTNAADFLDPRFMPGRELTTNHR